MLLNRFLDIVEVREMMMMMMMMMIDADVINVINHH